MEQRPGIDKRCPMDWPWTIDRHVRSSRWASLRSEDKDSCTFLVCSLGEPGRVAFAHLIIFSGCSVQRMSDEEKTKKMRFAGYGDSLMQCGVFEISPENVYCSLPAYGRRICRFGSEARLLPSPIPGSVVVSNTCCSSIKCASITLNLFYPERDVDFLQQDLFVDAPSRSVLSHMWRRRPLLSCGVSGKRLLIFDGLCGYVVDFEARQIRAIYLPRNTLTIMWQN
jgi:hypothetical protein